jgi:hypothetical protein
MAMNDSVSMSLTRLFACPDDFRGDAGVVCGLSADAAFMNAVLERFSGLTVGQRREEGRTRLALILDPCNPQIVPDSVPGMRHVPLRRDHPFFPLLHAKVAVLLFRRTDDTSDWILRLIVSTGNWNADENIDLFWTVEISSNALPSPKKLDSVNGADILAAWDFLFWILIRCCDHDLRMADPPADLPMLGDLDAALGRLRNELPSPSGPTRFFDNREESLLDGMMKRIKPLVGASTRDCLALGSGFFNNSKGEDGSGVGVFRTLQSIRKKLTDERLLTQKPQFLDLVVNPEKCQGVADADTLLRDAGWNLWKPSYLGGATNRFLHAKFIFSARQTDRASQSWLYLGSGNLTIQGFMKVAGHRGNLEAGVVFNTGTLDWDRVASAKLNVESVAYRLPLLFDAPLTNQVKLLAGEGMADPVGVFFAPPVSFFHWREDGEGGWLNRPESNESTRDNFIVIGSGGEACEQECPGYRWPGVQPRQVAVHWGNDGHEALVPVIGEDGRVAGFPLQSREIEELWDDLLGFPEPREVEEDDPDDTRDEDTDTDGGSRGVPPRLNIAKTPIRTIMRLVENIASRQRELKECDWKVWCVRLEQVLISSSTSIGVAEFQKLSINPLSPLLHAAFRPDFAQVGCAEGARYEAVIERVEKAWDVASLRGIGKQS